jgi:hypothetical protein
LLNLRLLGKVKHLIGWYDSGWILTAIGIVQFDTNVMIVWALRVGKSGQIRRGPRWIAVGRVPALFSGARRRQGFAVRNMKTRLQSCKLGGPCSPFSRYKRNADEF